MTESMWVEVNILLHSRGSEEEEEKEDRKERRIRG
jgi:hypothetical protein